MGCHDASRAIGGGLDLTDAGKALAWARQNVPDAFPETPAPPGRTATLRPWNRWP